MSNQKVWQKAYRERKKAAGFAYAQYMLQKDTRDLLTKAIQEGEIKLLQILKQHYS